LGKRNTRGRAHDRRRNPQRRQSIDAALPPSPRSECEVFEDLERLCSASGYIHAIAYLVFRDSVVTGGEEFAPEDFQKLYSKERLIRTEISTLVGLWLKGDRNAEIPTADLMQHFISQSDRLLAELHAAMLKPARAEFKAALEAHASGEAVGSPLGNPAAMKEAIFYSGESAFSSQYSEFARGRYADDRVWLEENRGIDIETAASMMEELIRQLSERIMPLFKEVRSKPMTEWTMLPLFCFTEEEVARFTGADPLRVSAFLRTFAVADDARNERFTNLFAFNEAGALPFVRLKDGTYAMLQEYVATEALYTAPSYWMRQDGRYAPDAAKHRGKFAEDLTYRLISRSFPKERIYQNVVFKRSKAVTAGEADLVLIQGKRAFVFQLKSKGLTELARSGDALAISRDFGAAVQHAYDQAIACIGLLKEGVPTYLGTQPHPLPNLKDVEEFYPVCITSENYPALSFQIGQYLQKVNSNEVKQPIIMDVFTLDVITEFLRSPLYLIDYLAKRSFVSDKIVSTHEMVLFSYHLRGNLYVPSNVSMMLLEDDFLCNLDLAMAVRRRGIPGEGTPPGILTRDLNNPLGNILKTADENVRPEVHQLGEFILNLSSDAWNTINKWVLDLAVKARHDGTAHDLTVPLDDAGAGLTIHCNDFPDHSAFQKLASHCEIRKYTHKSDRWFGVCLSAATEEVRFAIGRTGRWEYNAELDKESSELKVRSVRNWVDPAGRKGKMPGRNGPCPCGSGRKFKRCHGAN
jgi:hypothetical protein